MRWVVKRYSKLAAILLGSMLLFFVVLMHIPNIVAIHGARLFWATGLRDIAFSGGAFALAGSMSQPAFGRRARAGNSRALFRGDTGIVFGVEDSLHPPLRPAFHSIK